MRLSRRCQLALSACFLGLSGLSNAAAQAVYSFGDSLSDSGNVNDLSVGLFAGSDYFEGRFSNFYLWSDYLTALSAGVEQRRNQGLVGPFFEVTADGYNFAHGGSVSGPLGPGVNTSLFGGDLGFLSTLPAFRVTDQAEHFRDTRVFGQRAFTINPDDFATISAGGNDYFNGETDVNLVVGNITSAVSAIHEAGVRYMIVLDVPNVGDVPRRFGTQEADTLNALSADHNAALRTAMADFEADNPLSLVVVAPAARLFELIIDDAQSNAGGLFGFTNVSPTGNSTGNCLGDGLTLSACPDTYLFYDDIHPTGRAHALMAELTIATVRARIAGEAEPLSQTQGTNQMAASDGGVVASRLAALRLGLTGSGRLHDRAVHVGADGFGGASLGLDRLGGHASATPLSIYGRIEGQPLDVARLDSFVSNYHDLVTADLSFSPGEGLSSVGADMLWSPKLATGMLVSRARFDRDAFGFQQENEAESYAVYAASFQGPATFSLTTRHTLSTQTYRRPTGLSYAPIQSGAIDMQNSQTIAHMAYDLYNGPISLTALGKVTHANVVIDRAAETGTLGLIDRPAERTEFTSRAHYIGIQSSFTAPYTKGSTRITFDIARIGASDNVVGLASVIDELDLFRIENDRPLIFGDRLSTSPWEAQGGTFVAAQVGYQNDRLTISARTALTATDIGTRSVAKLGAQWRF